MANGALHLFMNQLIHESSGSTVNMTIISDNARAMTKKSMRKRRRSAPGRSRSLPLNRNRWMGAKVSSSTRPPPTMTTIADVAPARSRSLPLNQNRWMGATKVQRQTESLTLPTRAYTKSKKNRKKKLACLPPNRKTSPTRPSRKSEKNGICSAALPPSLRTLPY